MDWTSKAPPGLAKNLIWSFSDCMATLDSGGGGGRGTRQITGLRVALVGGVHEQLRLLDQLVRQLLARTLSGLLVGLEEVLRELAVRVLIPEQLRVDEMRFELANDLVRCVAQVLVLLASESARGYQHGAEGA